MDSLTENQITLLVAFVGLVAAFIGWMGRGLSFVLTRWWTQSPKRDHAIYLNSIADFAAKLRANGMTIEDVTQLETIMRNPSVLQSNAAAKVVEELADEGGPEAFHSNYAMKARTGAAYAVAEGQLEQALMDLRLLVGQDQAEVLEEVQKKWQDIAVRSRTTLFVNTKEAPMRPWLWRSRGFRKPKDGPRRSGGR